MGRVVTIQTQGTNARIIENIQSAHVRDVSAECAYEIAGAEHIMKQSRYRQWDGLKRLFHSGTRRFMAGLTPRVVRALKPFDYEIQHIDITQEPDPIELPFESGFVVRPYQEKALERWILGAGCRGILRVATGGGKTFIAAMCIKSAHTPTVFLVHTKDLLYQAIDVFTGIFGKDNVGQIGDGVVDIKPITVSTIQSLSRALDLKYESGDEDDRWQDEDTYIKNVHEFLDSRGMVVMDECHRVAAPTALDLIAYFRNAPFTLGLSASPWRDDGADLALEAAFGPVFYSVTASDLVRDGYLVPAKIRMIKVPAMPGISRLRYDQIYKKYVVENEIRNRLGVAAAMDAFRRGRTVMLLVRQIKHGKTLQEMLSEEVGAWVPFIHGSTPTVQRKGTLRDIREGKLKIFVASTIADEGLDLPALDTVVMMGSGKSSVKALQRVGRAVRLHPGKTHAEIYDFDDMAKHLVHHSQRRVQLYKTEDAWDVE